MNQQLIELARQKAGKKDLTVDASVGRVACAFKTKSGKIYTGINLKAAGDIGFCAEVTALAQMINDGETEIEILVGVNDSGTVIPPCGRCRELMYQINRSNLEAKVIFEDGLIALKELLPERWQEHWGGRE